MRKTVLALSALGAVAALAAAWWHLADPSGFTAARAPLPFGSHLATWIEEGVPIAAVADLDGREFLILVGDGDGSEWSAAVSPGEVVEVVPAPPVALGPASR